VKRRDEAKFGCPILRLDFLVAVMPLQKYDGAPCPGPEPVINALRLLNKGGASLASNDVAARLSAALAKFSPRHAPGVDIEPGGTKAAQQPVEAGHCP
jgi:hypothetical protein